MSWVLRNFGPRGRGWCNFDVHCGVMYSYQYHELQITLRLRARSERCDALVNSHMVSDEEVDGVGLSGFLCKTTRVVRLTGEPD